MPEISDQFYGVRLSTLCMYIGYLHLASSVAEIVYHTMVVGTVTNGFQCDVDVDKLREITCIPLLGNLLLLMNLGTHGFYPFPTIIMNETNYVFVEYMEVSSDPRCYPGMMHINQTDVINFILNLIWLRIVISYVGALRKRNPEPMYIFFNLSVVKFLMQGLYLFHQTQLKETYYIVYCVFKFLDGVIAITLFYIVWNYIQYLRAEIERGDKPPSYIECLIGSVAGKEEAERCEKKEAIVNVEDEKKPNLEASKLSPI